MTPKQMKYMALIGLMVVVLFLATLMSMGVTEGAKNMINNKCKKDPTKPLWDKSTKTCVAACPTGYSAKGSKCVLLKPAKVKNDKKMQVNNTQSVQTTTVPPPTVPPPTV